MNYLQICPLCVITFSNIYFRYNIDISWKSRNPYSLTITNLIELVFEKAEKMLVFITPQTIKLYNIHNTTEEI